MPRVNVPQENGLKGREHECCQFCTPNATGTLVTLTPCDWIAQTSLGQIIIHINFRVLGKQNDTVPVIFQAG